MNNTAHHTDAKEKAVRIPAPGCPACSHTLAFPVAGRTEIYTCAKCDAIFGTCYLGESYGMVLPFMVTVDPPVEQTRYFDFTCLGSKGLTRRHGWYDTASKLIVQVG